MVVRFERLGTFRHLFLVLIALVGGTLFAFMLQQYENDFVSASFVKRQDNAMVSPNQQTLSTVDDDGDVIDNSWASNSSPQQSYRTATTTEDLESINIETQFPDDEFDVELEQRRRKGHLNHACNRLGKSRELPSVSWESTVHFLASDKFNFLFCFVPKVSCTTWKAVMSTLYKAFPRSPPLKNTATSHTGRFLKMSDIRDPPEVLRRWRSYSKVMFTREPLERALSAYLDKFVYRKGGPFEQQFGYTILKRYRYPNVRSKTDLKKLVKFPLNDKNKITFDEFIRFITDKGTAIPMTQLTDHWLPIHRITKPCAFEYDFIGKYETLQYDAPHVIKSFNLSGHVTFPEVHSSRSQEKLIQAYSKVPRHLIDRLIEFYRDDYELFGYSPNRTLDIITRGSNS